MAGDHLPSSIAVSSGEATADHRHHDTRRRVFVGPMPEKVISQTEKQKKKKRSLFHHASEDEDSDDISEIIKNNAFSFFIREGGRPEDWGEDEERNVVEEMFRRWKGSEWARIWHHRKQNDASAATSNRPTNHWVGGSFEIGRFLGVNILKDTVESTRERPSLAPDSTRRTSISTTQATQDRPRASTSSLGHETFVTAPSIAASDLLQGPSDGDFNMAAHSGPTTAAGDSIPASSSTSLLEHPPLQPNVGSSSKAQTEILPRPATKKPSISAFSDGALTKDQKGKAKLVHYADLISENDLDERRVPPDEVLGRTELDTLQDTSAGAALSAASSPNSPSPPSPDWGDAAMRDRMLVRTYYTKSENISLRFDETQNRTTQNLLDADWCEYMVAWRRDRLELYLDYRLPGKEWLMGHKNLAFVIPLKSPRTHLSLYSFVDLTFCMTCEPTKPIRDGSKAFFSGHKEGTNIFIFKLKSRSRAYDWTWLLWRQLGGTLPSTIDVRNPRIDTKVSIDVPQDPNDGQAFQVFNRENIIELTTDAFRTVPNWKALIERELSEGKTLELAWRVDTNLDWIWLNDDVDGQERQWAVLCGLAVKQSKPLTALEIRLAEHYPTHIHLKNGSRLHEPPAIEGYVERVRPNSQVKQGLYLSTHDGNLFVMTPHHAYPPSPPGLAKNLANIDAFAETLRKSEVKRGALQVIHAIGVNDLRSILIIRRASHPTPQPMHQEALSSQESDIWFSIWSQTEERIPGDDEDVGGDEGLSQANDKGQLRIRRSFELLLTTGRVVRFETYSCRVAIEWIERLRALVLYWKQRHRIDAKEEMDLAQSRRPRLTPLKIIAKDNREVPPEAPPDNSVYMPALGTLYSWCVLDGCKSIVKGGKIFMRKGLFGQYKLVQLFLTAGHLTQFRITPKSSLHASMHKKTNLIDAYVCSGYLAASALPKGQYKASVNPGARRYQDGLETDDPEEDMLFMVWYRPQPPNLEHSVESTSTSPKNIPALSAKRKLLVFRTRSKLERDAWCWALNSEIEKLVRAQKDREANLRDTGKLMSL